jgi:phosphoribosylformimino-5-aminoimidazole carboxamide ribotide isomerase
MLAIPAVDLREGHVVQLVGGDYAKESVRLDDPRDVARRWAQAGFTRTHVVDLDAATGRGSNHQIVRDLLDDGADWIVIGTKGLEEQEWLDEVSHAHPGRIILAADVRERRVLTRGWAQELPRNIIDVVEDLAHLPLGGLLVTAVHREGLLQGTDLPLMEDVADASAWPVFASGGVTTMHDLRALEERGLAGAVLGMALYTGTLDPRIVAEEFSQ